MSIGNIVDRIIVTKLKIIQYIILGLRYVLKDIMHKNIEDEIDN